jgi:hypothetical protein
MDDKVILTGTARMGVVAFATALLLCGPSALAQDDTAASANVSPVTPLVAESAEAETETAWYDAFTLSMNDSADPLFDEPATVDWESENGRWGIMLGITDGRNESQIDDPDLSASAFYNFGDRFRVGGQVRLTSPEDDLYRDQEGEERQPEVKFESALRF